MPIINLPIERMERNKKPDSENYADDRFLDAAIAAELNRCLGGAPVHAADFFMRGAWSYVKRPSTPGFNIARGLPTDVTQSLAEDRSKTEAEQLPGSEWCSILRNAMAHGGIAYWAVDGHSRPDAPAAFFAFVSASYAKEDTRSGVAHAAETAKAA